MYSVLYVLAIPYLVLRLRRNNHMLQQHFYNENNRYLKWSINNINKVFQLLDGIVLILNIINLILKSKLLLFTNILYIGLFFLE